MPIQYPAFAASGLSGKSLTKARNASIAEAKSLRRKRFDAAS
jgi:hypothetical protein